MSQITDYLKQKSISIEAERLTDSQKCRETEPDKIIEWCSNYVWTSSSGIKRRLKDLEYGHLRNILNFSQKHKIKIPRFTSVEGYVLVEMMRRHTFQGSNK